MPVIVNADDFGRSEEVNKAISEAINRKFIARTTLMVNMPYADDAVKIALQQGFAGQVGIHLNLTEGKPLTEEIRSNSLFCDKEGYFHALFHTTIIHRLYMNRYALEQVYKELKAQLEKFNQYGLTLWHIDSHHHVHTDFPVYCVLKKLSQEYNFSSIRISRNLYFGGNIFTRLYKKIYNDSIKKLCRETTDLFGSYLDYETYIKAGGAPAQSTLEIMVHPMYDESGALVDTDIPMTAERFLGNSGIG